MIWTATLVSNVGLWMQNAAAGWLMTTLAPEPHWVAMVQSASLAPMFLLGLPAGAFADIFDRRRLLLSMEITGTLLTASFALLATLGLASPLSLLIFLFLAGAAAALIAPAWQAILPQLVESREDLAPAVSIDSAGLNISRAIGPALAGIIIGYFGMAAPFWFNACCNLGCILALYRWRPAPLPASGLPPESAGGAMMIGLRHVRNNQPLRATLMRSIGFFVFASAYWALLPLLVRKQIAGGPELYGLLLGSIGAGAVAGAFAMPHVKARLGADRMLVLGSVLSALALLLFGLSRHPATAFAAGLLAGVSWIAAVATLNVSAQLALPAWVRGRGLAAYVTVMFGSMAFSSAGWGRAAETLGISASLYLAAAGAIVSLPLLMRWRLSSGDCLDLTPSMHWPAPVLTSSVDNERGPVLVTIEYRVAPQHRDAFLAAIRPVADERKRNGAYRWGVFEDTAVTGRWLETFLVDSWAEHLRQHARVTQADRAGEQALLRFQTEGTPLVTHYLAP